MLPRFRAGAFWLFVLTFVASVLLGDQAVGAQLRFDPVAVAAMDGIWRPFSGVFTYPETALGGVALTLVVQWYIGGRLEEFWGTRRYVVLVLGAATFGYAVTAAVVWFVPAAAFPTSGATPLDVATLTAFGVVFGRTTYSLPGVAAPLSGRALALFMAIPVLIVPMLSGTARGWGLAVPSGVALVVTAVVLQPWRRRDKAGTLPKRRPDHLRLVRGPDDLLH